MRIQTIERSEDALVFIDGYLTTIINYLRTKIAKRSIRGTGDRKSLLSYLSPQQGPQLRLRLYVNGIHRYKNLCITWTMTNCMFYQVIEDTFHLHVISIDERELRLKLRTDGAPGQYTFEAQQSTMHNLGNVAPFFIQYQCSHLNTRHFNERVNEDAEVIGFCVNFFEDFTPCLLIPCNIDLQKSCHRGLYSGKRGTQIMRHG